MEYVDNVYVINMDKSTDRLKNMQKQVGIIGRQFIRIPAVVGADLTRSEISAAATFTCGLFCTYSMIGIFLSHKKAWENIVTNNDKYGMILEDDCSLVPDFQDEFKKCIKELNDVDKNWDFLYLGCFGGCNVDKSKYDILTKIQSVFLKKIKAKPSNKYTFIPESPVGFHCYIISQKCARLLLKLMNAVDYHVDVSFLQYSDNFNIYASSKTLAYQYASSENSTQTVSFPIILNKFFDNYKCEKQISYSYYMSAPIFGISKYNVNVYFIVFIILALLATTNKHLSIGLVTYLIIELGLDPSNYEYIFLWGMSAALILLAKNKIIT